MVSFEDTKTLFYSNENNVYVKNNKFSICIIEMIVGITLLGSLPFMGLDCRWC